MSEAHPSGYIRTTISFGSAAAPANNSPIRAPDLSPRQQRQHHSFHQQKQQQQQQQQQHQHQQLAFPRAPLSFREPSYSPPHQFVSGRARDHSRRQEAAQYFHLAANQRRQLASSIPSSINLPATRHQRGSYECLSYNNNTQQRAVGGRLTAAAQSDAMRHELLVTHRLHEFIGDHRHHHQSYRHPQHYHQLPKQSHNPGLDEEGLPSQGQRSSGNFASDNIYNSRDHHNYCGRPRAQTLPNCRLDGAASEDQDDEAARGQGQANAGRHDHHHDGYLSGTTMRAPDPFYPSRAAEIIGFQQAEQLPEPVNAPKPLTTETEQVDSGAKQQTISSRTATMNIGRAGGQRTALKLVAATSGGCCASSGPLMLADCVQHQRQPHSQMMPMAGYGPPAMHRQQQLCVAGSQLECHSEAESDCSCSNSIDCLTLSQHSSSALANYHGGLPPPMPQLNSLNSTPIGQHQMTDGASQQQQNHASNANSVQQHQNKTNNPMAAQHEPQVVVSASSANSSSSNTNNNKNISHNHNNANTSLSNFHRPIHEHSTASAPLDACLTAAPPPPPPLMRHNTYTATSETITDASLLTAGLANHQQLSDYNHPASQMLSPIDQRRPESQQQSSAQRAPKTMGHHMGADMRHHGSGSGGSRQVSFRRATTADYPHRSSSSAANYATRNPRQRSLPHQQPICPASPTTNGGGGASNSPVIISGSANNRPLMSVTSAPASATIRQQQQQHQFGPTHVATYPPLSPLPGTTLPLARTTSHNLHTAPTHGLPPIQGHLFDPTCPPMPPILSHRTNSPWMRISSIILTPIGMVIILFIVVSPLLHYLM